MLELRRPRPAAPCWCLRREWCFSCAPLDPDPLDFPMQLYTVIRFNPLAHGFAQRFNVMAGGVTGVDQEVAVHFRYLRAADTQAAAAGGIDQLPGAVPRRILEGGAAGLFTNRLSCLAVGLNLVHACANGFWRRDRPAEFGRGEDDGGIDAAVAIDELHVGVGEGVLRTIAADPGRLDQHVPGLAAIGAGIHPQRAADGAGNAEEEL